MAWVALCTVAIYLLVNIPLLYSLVAVHGREGIGALWGYAPNQFLFLVVPFPLATFCTFVALRIVITEVNPTLPKTALGKWIFDHWMGGLLLGLSLAALLAFGAYLRSTMSLDKLHPQYAT